MQTKEKGESRRKPPRGSQTATFQVVRCTRCVTPDCFPGIRFNPRGVCPQCLAYDKKFRDWRETTAALDGVLNRKRRSGSKYRAIVGVSGGKDSCYVLHVLAKDFGARDVLAVTNDNGFLADGARENIRRMTDALGLDHCFCGPDRDVTTRLYRVLVEKKCADWCLFCMAGITSGLLEVAMREKVSVIVTGASPRTEPTFPFEMLNWFDFTFLKDVVAPHIGVRELRPFRNIRLFFAAYATFVKGIRFVNLPEYVEWDEPTIVETLRHEYGWVDYGKDPTHFDCLISPAVDYFMRQRLGVDKVTERLSVLIRAGRMSRDEALVRLVEHEQAPVPEASLDAICCRLGIPPEILEPYRQGNALSYRCFKNNVQRLRRVSFLFWIAYKLGFGSRLLYEKYRRVA